MSSMTQRPRTEAENYEFAYAIQVEAVRRASLIADTDKDPDVEIVLEEEPVVVTACFSTADAVNKRRKVCKGCEGRNSAAKRSSEACSICLEEELMFVIQDCKHSFCRTCLGKVVDQQILEERKFPVGCPAPRCAGTIAAAECEEFGTQRAMEEMRRLEVAQSIAEDERFYCPHSSCSELMVKPTSLPESDPGSAECPACHRLVCVRCCARWHAGLSCGAFQALPPDMRGAEDQQLARLAGEQRWRQCGKCKNMVERAEGCNHIRCRCSGEFCSCCGKAWAAGEAQCTCALFEVPPEHSRGSLKD